MDQPFVNDALQPRPNFHLGAESIPPGRTQPLSIAPLITGLPTEPRVCMPLSREQTLPTTSSHACPQHWYYSMGQEVEREQRVIAYPRNHVTRHRSGFHLTG